MSTATIELSSTRRKLFDVLGDNQQQYLDHLKVFLFIAHVSGQSNNVIQAWFRKRCSKEEFDAAARKLLTQESVHLHNQFLLAVWMPCKFRYSPQESFYLWRCWTSARRWWTLLHALHLQSSSHRAQTSLSFSLLQSLSNQTGLHSRSVVSLELLFSRLKKGKIKRKSKPNRASLEHRFQPVQVGRYSLGPQYAVC